MASYGYARVSTKSQNPARQLELLYQCAKEIKIFIDKCSGGVKERPELDKCLSSLKRGDTLYCHSIDRLARNLQHFLELVLGLKSNGVSVHFLKEKIHITPENDPLTELYLNLFAAFAQFERALINERREEGWAIMKENRVAKGLAAHPASKLTLEQEKQLEKDILSQKMMLKELSEKYHLSISNLSIRRKKILNAHGVELKRFKTGPKPKQPKEESDGSKAVKAVKKSGQKATSTSRSKASKRVLTQPQKEFYDFVFDMGMGKIPYVKIE